MRKPIVSMILAIVCSQVVFAADVAQILNETGIKGGIIVHIGCDDPGRLAELGAGTACVVHGLDTDAVKVAKARAFLSARRVHGPVSASVYNGKKLPYIDNLVNLVIADELGPLTREEVLRVLAPLGVAWIGGQKLVKPWPKELDEWPQYLHEADNNAVSRDTAVGPPRHMQWVTGPLWSRSHMAIATVNSMVTARGRIFTIEDRATVENPFLPGRFALVARDAFNGVVLWEYPFETWEPVTRYIKDMAVQLQRRLAAIGDRVYCTPAIDAPLTAFDAKTGEVLKVYGRTRETQEFVYHNNTIYAIATTDADADSTSVVAAHTDTLDEVGNIDDSQTAFTVDAGAGWPTAPFTILIGTEQMRVTDVSTNEFTVTRGYDGTTAAIANDGATITHYIDEATTVFDVDAGGVVVANDRIKIGTAGTEEIKVVSVSTNRLTVARGENSTTAAVIADAGEIWKVYGPEEALDLSIAESNVPLEESMWGAPVSSLAV